MLLHQCTCLGEIHLHDNSLLRFFHLHRLGRRVRQFQVIQPVQVTLVLVLARLGVGPDQLDLDPLRACVQFQFTQFTQLGQADVRRIQIQFGLDYLPIQPYFEQSVIRRQSPSHRQCVFACFPNGKLHRV